MAKKHLVIGAVKYPVELDSSLPRGEWYLRGKPMFDLDEKDIKRAAHEIGKGAERIRERLLKDAMYGGKPPYSPLVSTARMAASINRFVPLWTVITSPYIVEKKKHSREKKRTFWRRLLDGLTDLNPWPYSLIEIYEVEVPAIMIDRPNYRIICHPSLTREIKAMTEGKL